MGHHGLVTAHGHADPEPDPFATPRTSATPSAAELSPHEARERAGVHEVRIERIASWMLFFGMSVGLYGVAVVVSAARIIGSAADVGGPRMALGATLVAVGLVQLFAGFGLRDLQPRGRILALIGSLALLPLFPVGTWIGVRSIIHLLSPGGRRIVTSAEAEVRAATPELDRPRRAPIVPLSAPFVIVGMLFAIARLMKP